MVKNFLKKFSIFLVFLFLYAPIIVLIIFSFNNSKSRGHWDGLTLKWYIQLFQDPQILKTIYYTLAVAVLSSLVATIFGTAAALGIDSMTRFRKTVVMNITYLPVLNPDIVTGVSLMLLFVFVNIKLGFISLLLCTFLIFPM